MTVVMIFLKHEHLSPLGTKLRFTSSFHAETTRQLSGSTNPQCVLLDWNQKSSAKKALAPINSHLSSRDTAPAPPVGRRNCVVQPTAFPARSEEEEDDCFGVQPHAHTLNHFCRVRSSRGWASLGFMAAEAYRTLTQKLGTGLGTDIREGLHETTSHQQWDSGLLQ